MNDGNRGRESVEQRWSKRRSIAMQVMIYRYGIPAVRTRSIDIGLAGMRVEDTGVEFSGNAPLHVEFANAWQGGSIRHRLPVRVVHRSLNGLGLMFCSSSPSTAKAIEDYLAEGRDQGGA